MNFEATEIQKKLVQDAIQALQKFDDEYISRHDREGVFPREMYNALAKSGLTGLVVPKQYGGAGLGVAEVALIAEETGVVGLSGITLTLHGQLSLLRIGTEDQRQRYLPGLCSGEFISAVVVSELEAGSNLKNMKTFARREGDHYVISGQKHHITLGDEADLMVLFAQTEAGITTFLVEKKYPGISTAKMDAIGWRLDPHYDIHFDNVKVPVANRLGEEGDGMKTFFASFNITRICNASHLIGVARAALRDSVQYAMKRSIGPSKVSDFQGIQWLIAETATKIEAATLMRNKAAWMADQGMPHERETAMAKLLALEAATSATNNSFSLVGGHGCYRETPFERYLRDVKVGQATGGSPEVMKNNIAKSVLRSFAEKNTGAK